MPTVCSVMYVIDPSCGVAIQAALERSLAPERHPADLWLSVGPPSRTREYAALFTKPIPNIVILTDFRRMDSELVTTNLGFTSTPRTVAFDSTGRVHDIRVGLVHPSQMLLSTGCPAPLPSGSHDRGETAAPTP